MIYKYVVTSNPDKHEQDEWVFDWYKDAKTLAATEGKCVVELQYEFFDSELIFDYRDATDTRQANDKELK